MTLGRPPLESVAIACTATSPTTGGCGSVGFGIAGAALLGSRDRFCDLSGRGDCRGSAGRPSAT